MKNLNWSSCERLEILPGSVNSILPCSFKKKKKKRIPNLYLSGERMILKSSCSTIESNSVQGPYMLKQFHNKMISPLRWLQERPLTFCLFTLLFVLFFFP